MKPYHAARLLMLLLPVFYLQNRAIAQSFYTHTIDSLLANIDTSKVPTSILYDRSFPVSRLFDFGTAIDDTSDADRFIQSYSELYWANYSRPGFVKSVDQIKAYISQSAVNGEVPLGFLNVNYNTIRPDALSQNLLRKDTVTGLYYDVPGRPSEPYALNKLVMAAPLIRITNYYNPVKFVYDPNVFVLQNDFPSAIDSIAINFNDGQAARVIKGTALNTRQVFSIQYSGSNGSRPIGFVIRLKDGRVFHITGRFNYRQICTDYTCPIVYNGCTTFRDTVNSTIVYQGILESAPRYGRGEYRVYFRKNGCDLTVRKPVLWMTDLNLPLTPEAVTFGYKKLFDTLLASGYDIITFNNQNYQAGTQPDGTPIMVDGNADYLERRATTLIAMIQKINRLKTGNEKLVVIGVSQTGAIARLALAYMEKNNIDHQTRLFVSIDGAQLGGNGPIGEQYCSDAYSKKLGDEIFRNIYPVTDIRNQELGMHYYTANSVSPAGAPVLRYNWQHLLDSIGFPHNCRNIATANGNTVGMSYPGNRPFFKARIIVRPTTNLFFFKTRFTDSVFAEYTVRLTADKGSSAVVFEERYPNFSGANAYSSKTAIPTQGSVSPDICPGSFIVSNVFNAFLNKSQDINAQPKIRTIFSDTSTTGGYFIIIPTKSALAVTNSNPDLGEPLCRNLIQTHETPFDAYLAPQDNQLHTILVLPYSLPGVNSSAFEQFVYDEIQGNRSSYGVYPDTQVSPCNSLASAATTISGYLVYPNPSQNILKVELKPEAGKSLLNKKNIPANFTVRLYDMNMIMLKQAESVNGQLILNTSDLQFGVYYLNISKNNETETVKIIVQK